MNKAKNILEQFFRLGETTVEVLVNWFFNIGIGIAFVKSLVLGAIIYNVSTYDKTISFISDGVKRFTSVPAPNLPLALASSIVAFLISVVIWKFICEFILIVLKYFQSNTKK